MTHFNGTTCRINPAGARARRASRVDQVMIYNRSLNGSEIQGHYLADYRGGTVSLYIDGILATDGNFTPWRRIPRGIWSTCLQVEDLTMYGNTGWTKYGVRYYALSFDGVDDFANTSCSISGPP